MNWADVIFWAVFLAFPVGAIVHMELQERGYLWPPAHQRRGRTSVEFEEMLVRRDARRARAAAEREARRSR